MKKRTLNQTWILCLRMWKWVSKEWLREKRDIEELKKLWLKENGFGMEISTCFFCSYADTIDGTCDSCPGRFIDSFFSCFNKEYHYGDKPVEFYQELLRLNRIRKAKK